MDSNNTGVTAQSTEVSKKVKSAIKAKLMELGAYVDDELPDYIMILVGNKKTKDQMDDDLSLFLGHNTERFTLWLHNVLQKLNAASVLQNPTKIIKEKEKKKEEEKVIEPVVGEEKKKHKKKKDKSEKKKEKKEKKKKKDKDRERDKSEKNSKSHKKDKQVSPKETINNGSGKELIDTVCKNERSSSSSPVFDKSVSGQPEKNNILSAVKSEGAVALDKREEEENLAEDIVDLRPDAEDLTLDLEDEVLPKKKKENLKKEKTDELLPRMSIEIKVPNAGEKRSSSIVVSEAEDREKAGNVHDRLGPALTSSSKRIINLREESSFPIKSNANKVDGLGRAVSSAIASAVKSVTLSGTRNSDVKSGKKLEARVRPLISSKPKPDERQNAEVSQISAARVVSTVGAILKRSHSNDDSDDSEQPAAKRLSGVASKVEVTPRPRRPGSMQANTALILRAVADAHKSVSKSTKKLCDEKDEESLKKGIYSRSYQERQTQRLGLSVGEGKNVKKFAITVPNALLKENVQMHLSGKPVEIGRKENFVEDAEMQEEFMTQLAEPIVGEERVEGRTMDIVEEGPEKPPHMKNAASKKLVPAQANDPSGSTRFIVTLDGFGNESGDLRSRLSGRPVRTPSVDEEEYIEEVEEWEEEVEEMEGVSAPSIGDDSTSVQASVGTKTKTKIDSPIYFPKKEERCRFWPVCMEGDACKFIHPSKVCIMFPNCRFGDKCIYIHPSCKYGATCTKINCPFAHSSPRQLPLATVALKTNVAALPLSKIKCHYYPKCVNMNCPYLHPKQMCRYGIACQMANCPFVHPAFTTGASLKWTRPKSTITKSSMSSTKHAPNTESVTSSLTSASSSSTVLTKPILSSSSVETQQ